MGTYVFKLPDVGEGTAEAEITAWHVKPGDVVVEDQPLVDVMTDKATVEITSPVSGVVRVLHGEIGAMAPVGGPLVELLTEGEASAEPEPAPSPAQPARAAPEPVASAPEPAPEPRPAPRPDPVRMHSRTPPPRDFAAELAKIRSQGERPLASPAVRREAAELGVDLRRVKGTGPAGRIERADLAAYHNEPEAAAQSAAPATGRAPKEGIEEVRIIGLRRRIAEKMQAAKRHIPHITYVEEIDVTELEDLRAHLNTTRKAGQAKLTVLPFIGQALLKALPDHPQINARYDDEAGVLTRYDGLHLGVATQTPGGLMVPVVRHAEALDLYELAAEIARVAEAARQGTATREELSGSTLTITSLGTLGGVVHTPVINWPEVAIVGPNKIIERPVVRGGQIAVRKMMNLSSSFDHRIIDGWDAAAFVQKIKAGLEHPAVLFMS